MVVIKEPALSRLTTAELRSLAEGTVTTLSPLSSDAHITRSLEVVKGALSAITNVNNTPLASDVTEQINITDSDMDGSLRLARNVMETNVAMATYDPDKAAACETLLALMEKRSNALFDGGYVEQGAEVTDFLSDVFDDELTVVREASGVAPILDTIKSQFTKLKELLAARAAEESAPTTIKEQKQILRFRLEVLLDYVNVNCIDKVDGFAEVVTPLNDIITTVMGQCKARLTRKENRDVVEN